MGSAKLGFEPLQHLRDADFEPIGHFPDGFGEIMFHLLLCDAAEGFVFGCHADIGRLVEAAEDAHLRELGHPGEQHELQIGIRPLEDGVETLQHRAVPVLQTVFRALNISLDVHVQHIQYRLVVLVHQDHATAAVLLVRLRQHVGEAVADGCPVRVLSINSLPIRHIAVQLRLQISRFEEVGGVEVDMEHGVFEPVFLQSLYRQPLEKLLPTLEVILQRGDQQALAETARTAQDIDLPHGDQLVYQISLVHIDITVFPNLLKGLYPYWKFHHGWVYCAILQIYI